MLALPPRNAAILRDLAQNIRSILAIKRLTIAEVSRRSAALYGQSSNYFIPQNFYYELRRATFTPSIYQFAALSRISGYHLSHWLRLFGLDLEDVSRVQVQLAPRRTMLLDSALVDGHELIPFFRNKSIQMPAPAIAPLSRLVEFDQPKPLWTLPQLSSQNFLYAKIGREDALSFPELIPGSIVRVHPKLYFPAISSEDPSTSGSIYLIAHSKGLCCCRLRKVGKNLVAPVSTKLPYGQVELRYPGQIGVLGVVDLEIRPLARPVHWEVPKDLAKRWKPYPLDREFNFGQLLRSARAKMNLSLHAASELSRQVAEELRDKRYFIALSTLSDYEIKATAPRHVHKIITLCAIYGVHFYELLRAAGISEASGVDTLPDRFTPIAPGPELGEASAQDGGFLAELLNRCGEVPVFLRTSLTAFSGLGDPSLEDFFWIGGDNNPLHPYLRGGLIIMLDRRKKRPLHSREKPLWEQPLYLLLQRNGTYLAACCSIEDKNLIIHPYPQLSHRSIQFRNHQDAEVIGQIVAVAREIAR